jgi:hypothetical protein
MIIWGRNKSTFGIYLLSLKKNDQSVTQIEDGDKIITER